MFEVTQLEYYWQDGLGQMWIDYFGAFSLGKAEALYYGIVHNSLPEPDEGPTCAGHIRHEVGKVAIDQNWCSSCTKVIIDMTVVTDCDGCEEDQVDRYKNSSGNRFKFNPSDLCALEADEIQQVLNSPTTFGEDGLFPWSVPIKSSHPVLKRLGLCPECPICFGLAKSALSVLSKHSHENMTLQEVYVTKICSLGECYEGSQGSFPLQVLFKWSQGGAEPYWDGSEFRLFAVSSGPPWLQYHDILRYNPAYVKLHIQQQFEKYPDNDLHQTREYPPSFRLIDVNRRCVVRIGNKHVRYSAISYRWDSTDTNMLNPETENKFAQDGSLSTDTMSKTLYDCMTMAQLLEIPYIWIDRYCIMQNDSKEKAEQVHAMGDIYANSHLTMICALCKDINSGLPGYTRDFDGPWIAPSSDGCWGMSGNIPYLSGIRSEWQQRGWTMQEEYLSPRRLYFTDSTILWHINCPIVSYHHADLTVEPECRAECEAAKSRSSFDLIHEYSRRQLTFTGDRINAISGLLKTRGIEHVFGMPTRRIHYALSWQPAYREEKFNHQFPTWSWASSLNLVRWWNFEKRRNQPKCRILHANTSLQNEYLYFDIRDCLYLY